MFGSFANKQDDPQYVAVLNLLEVNQRYEISNDWNNKQVDKYVRTSQKLQFNKNKEQSSPKIKCWQKVKLQSIPSMRKSTSMRQSYYQKSSSSPESPKKPIQSLYKNLKDKYRAQLNVNNLGMQLYDTKSINFEKKNAKNIKIRYLLSKMNKNSQAISYDKHQQKKKNQIFNLKQYLQTQNEFISNPNKSKQYRKKIYRVKNHSMYQKHEKPNQSNDCIMGLKINLI